MSGQIIISPKLRCFGHVEDTSLDQPGGSALIICPTFIEIFVIPLQKAHNSAHAPIEQLLCSKDLILKLNPERHTHTESKPSFLSKVVILINSIVIHTPFLGHVARLSSVLTDKADPNCRFFRGRMCPTTTVFFSVYLLPLASSHTVE